MDPAPKMVTWCNFTVVIRMDEDDWDGTATELQSDQADVDSEDTDADFVSRPMFSSSPSLLHPEEEEGGDFLLADDGDDVSGSTVSNADASPQAPVFTRLKKMETIMSQVKPAGSTVTYKCPANGKIFCK